MPNELAVSGECDLTAPGWPVQVVGEAVLGATNGVVKAVTNATTCGALQQNATNTSITNSFWNTTFTRTQLSELQAANMRAQFYARTANTAGVTSHSATTNQLFVEPDIEPVRNNISGGIIVFEDIAQIGDTCRVVVAFNADSTGSPLGIYTVRANTSNSPVILAGLRLLGSGEIQKSSNTSLDRAALGISNYRVETYILGSNHLVFLALLYVDTIPNSNNTHRFSTDPGGQISKSYQNCRVVP